LMGSCTQRDLVHVYQRADIFALTPFVTDDGDRDGIPNVLMEAMACGLPVLTTDAGGISEVVTHGVNGLVVAPHDVDGIAAGLETLMQNAELRMRLGAAARDTVIDGFDSLALTAELASIFRAVGGAPSPPARMSAGNEAGFPTGRVEGPARAAAGRGPRRGRGGAR
jgi:glycosyltransferase involved in cell wall biosynthesis